MSAFVRLFAAPHRALLRGRLLRCRAGDGAQRLVGPRSARQRPLVPHIRPKMSQRDLLGGRSWTRRFWLASADRSPGPNPQPIPRRFMLCIELRALLSFDGHGKQPLADSQEQAQLEKSLGDLFERLRVHVSATMQQIILVYYFEGTLKEARTLLERFPTTAEPDILCTLHGTEIYQRGYLAPDPYWEQQMATVGLGLDPKPIAWIMQESFGRWLRPQFDEKALSRRKSMVDMASREIAYLEYSWRSDTEQEIDRAQLIDSIQRKIHETGFASTRCVISPVTGNLLLIPSEASISRCLQFILNMVRLSANNVVLVGSESSALLRDAVELFEIADPKQLLGGLAPELLEENSTAAVHPDQGPRDTSPAGVGALVLLPSSGSDMTLNIGASNRFQLVKASVTGATGITEALLTLGRL